MLPKIEEGQTIPVTHFPTKFQALIFRLWESVPAKRIAEVLKTDEENVKNLAADMGLGEQKWLEDWMDRGYISIIRHAWNLLPYSQLCTLLGWNEERLEFVLKEDDFLEVKLAGPMRIRTDCEEIFYRELTDDEKKRTRKIKQSMEESVHTVDKRVTAEKPFSFFNNRYSPITQKKRLDVTVDSTWAINVNCEGVSLYVDDFKAEAKSVYGVEFLPQSQKTIEINIDVMTDDEEYHEIYIDDNKITLNAGSTIGIMRGLYFLLDLANGAGALSFCKKTYKRKTKVKTRFIYSFCGLYGDVLDKDSKISFPDELLKGYAKQGINGVWIQGVFYTLAPYPFAPEKCIGWEERLKNLDEITKRLARYGIKVYMYINEPRNLDIDFFEKRPDLMGTRHIRKNNACLCSSHPEVHKYLKDTIKTILKSAPLLGGFLCITQSENSVLCYSGGIDKADKPNFCPVCKKRKGSHVVADFIKTMAEAMNEVSDKYKFFAYAWGWKLHFKEELEELVERLPKNVIVLQVSESEIKFNRGGVDNFVRDYSLSIVGPGEPAKELWEMAKKYDLEIGAKVQINNSWECSTTPFLPVYENVIAHMKNLIDLGIEHVMLSWTLGGYVSDNIKIASVYFFQDSENNEDPYDIILNNTYGEYLDKIKTAVSHFCKGFSEYPFELEHIYNGPSNAGAANILYPEPTGVPSTMTGYPYDDVVGWGGGVYTPEIMQSQYEKLCNEWEKGLKIIEDIPSCEFKDMSFYGYSLFKASYNQISYYIERDGEARKNVMRKLVESEKELAILVYDIMLRNSAVGFEASNHYYITRTSMMEKIINCDFLLENL